MSAFHGANQPVLVTFFSNFAAATKQEETICLRDLVDRIVNTSAAGKGELPWLKLSTFGDLRTDANSLRHNPNVLAITGIEADYDEERIGFDDAVAILTEVGVASLVYTSPSHTEDAPRWRVLCPISKPMPPAQRDLYVARLNGLFGGRFARESWTLSQSYYFGSVNHNPSHRVELIEGTPIDLMDDLDAGAIGRPETKAINGHANERPVGCAGDSYIPISDTRLERFCMSVRDNLRRQAVDGQKHFALRNAALILGGIQWAAGFTDAEAVQWMMDALPPSVLDWKLAQETALWGLAQGRQRPIELPDRPRSTNGGRALPEPPPATDEADYGSMGRENNPQEEAQPSPGNAAGDGAALRRLLSIEAWAKRDIPSPDRLLGDLITKTTRMFLVGRTGLGKTLLGLAIAAGIASGQGFLHWSSSRPARVVYLDGEMPAELIKPRAIDAMRRLGVPIPPENLLIFGRDIEARARRICPSLPPFAALNTDEGRLFMVALLAAIGDVDMVIFDNVMSLIAGDMKDEVPWSETMSLVAMLTDMRIGQLWLDHTGHNTDRQYGSSTKAWRFDAVGLMTPLADGKPDPQVTAFTLSFDYPGKARRRTPDNWQEFQPRTIRLVDDQWEGEPVEPQVVRKVSRVGPAARAQYDALSDALVVSPKPGQTTKAAWYAECVRLGLADAVPSDATGRERDQKMKSFRARLSELKVAGWIGVNGDDIYDLKGRRK
jgi:AAA domain